MRLPIPMLAFACALALGGCLGRSPRPDFYRLSSRAAAAAPVASLPGLGLVIGAIEFPRYLDRPEILARDGEHRLVPASGPRWGAPLRSEVQRVLADDLAALLGTTRLAVHPVEPRFPIDYRVLVDVRAFEGVPARTVALRARWIVAGPDGRALVVEESQVEQPVTSASWDAYAAAHSEALGALTRQIGERIAALAAP
jgi:hypothetical protein